MCDPSPVNKTTRRSILIYCLDLHSVPAWHFTGPRLFVLSQNTANPQRMATVPCQNRASPQRAEVFLCHTIARLKGPWSSSMVFLCHTIAHLKGPWSSSMVFLCDNAACVKGLWSSSMVFLCHNTARLKRPWSSSGVFLCHNAACLKGPWSSSVVFLCLNTARDHSNRASPERAVVLLCTTGASLKGPCYSCTKQRKSYKPVAGLHCTGIHVAISQTAAAVLLCANPLRVPK